MDKDFDYEDFMNFMKHYGLVEGIEPSIPSTTAIIQQQDTLEVDVATRPCYTNIEDMLNAVKEM
jgi:hypothetical protein